MKVSNSGKRENESTVRFQGLVQKYQPLIINTQIRRLSLFLAVQTLIFTLILAPLMVNWIVPFVKKYTARL